MTPSGNSDYTILIADDEPTIRMALAALLSAEAYHVVSAKNGAEALALAEIVLPDVILLDVMMPTLDGLEACRRLRADPRLEGVPIVLVTALSDRATRLDGLEAGADDFIYKPFDDIELLTRVRAMLRFNRYRQRIEEHLRLEAERQQALHLLQMQNDELRRTQAQLEEARAGYVDLYDLAPVGYLTLSEPGLILEANLTAAGQLGVERGALVGQPLTRFILPEDQDLYYQLRRQLFENGSSQTSELRLTRADASPFWARLEATAARAAGDAPVCRAVISDITARVRSEQQRRQAEAALRESEVRYRELVNNQGEGLGLVDAQERFIFANPAAEKTFGVAPGQLVGRSVLEFLAPEQQAAARAQTTLRRQGEATVYELEICRADGQLRTLLVTALPRLGPDGQFTGTFGVFRDITERRQVETKLRENEERYRFLVDHLPAGVLMYAADGRLVLSNPKAAEYFGLSPEAMQGRRVSDPDWQFVREDTSPMPAEEHPATQVLSRGQAVSNQVIGIRSRAAGDCRWMLANAFPDFDAQGQIQQAVVLLTDISRRKEAEAALKTSETRYRELYRAAQRQAQEMALLDQVRTVVASELDLVAVIRKVVGAVAETFGYPLVSLYLRQGETMVLQHQVGYEAFLLEIPVSSGIIGRVMRTGQPVLASDVHADPDFLEAAAGVTSEACVPLFDGGQAVGALNIETRGAKLADADLRLLTALGEHIGLALGRARLYTRVREDAATEATLLHEVNHRVKNNLSAIIGLLQLEQDHIPALQQGPHLDLIGDLIGRIRSLASVHDLLSEVRWAPLPITDLADRIVRAAVAVAAPRFDLAVEIPPSAVQVTPKQASALALIINELATNSLKHALPKALALCLRLEIRQAGRQIELVYSDNGPGFPPEVLGGERQNVGLHLIRLLSRHDLRGRMDLSNSQGAVVRIAFGAAAAGTPATGPFGLPRMAESQP